MKVYPNARRERFYVEVTQAGFPYVIDTAQEEGPTDKGFGGRSILGGSVDGSPDGTRKSIEQAATLNALASFSHSPLSLATVQGIVDEQRAKLQKNEPAAYSMTPEDLCFKTEVSS